MEIPSGAATHTPRAPPKADRWDPGYLCSKSLSRSQSYSKISSEYFPVCIFVQIHVTKAVVVSCLTWTQESSYSLGSLVQKRSQFCHRMYLGREEGCSSYLSPFQKQSSNWCKKVFFFLWGSRLDGDFLHGRDTCWCYINPAEHPAHASTTPRCSRGGCRSPEDSAGGKGPEWHGREEMSNLLAALSLFAKRDTTTTSEYKLFWRLI